MEPTDSSAVRMRPRIRADRTTRPPRIAVFTAMEDALVDVETLDAGSNRPVLERLLERGIPVIPVSVMTLEELVPVARGLGLRHSMIIEAGGAIARWSGEGWDVEACGPSSETLLDVVREIEDRSGANLLLYSALSPSEAARVSGRTDALLAASTHRQFSEPFLLESGDLGEVHRAAATLGFSVRAGRRFLHLCRECDQGEAFTRVREEVGCDVTIGVGGSVVDLEFLRKVDIPIVLPAADGTLDPELMVELPHARVAAPAPAGWAIVEEFVHHESAARRPA
jgi:predicted mannosyl-3-phosphoglycerate phosphatase (HAD superfamily)